MSESIVRDEEWLENLLSDIWYKYFFDVTQDNNVKIVFGRKAKRRLGSISLDPNDRKTTIITVNRLYQDPFVPEYVVVATIVHEMTHYAHGFNSPHKQKHKYPHSGGVIRKEFAERGLEKLYIKQQKWLKSNWQTVINKHFVQKPSYSRIRIYGSKNNTIKKPWWIRIS